LHYAVAMDGRKIVEESDQNGQRLKPSRPTAQRGSQSASPADGGYSAGDHSRPPSEVQVSVEIGEPSGGG
jgi:hypothetical protein